MKKTIFLFCFIILICNNINAQDLHFTFGFKGGTNLTWAKAKGGAKVNNELIPNATLGFIAEFYFTDHLAIGTGFNVNWANAKYGFNGIIEPSGYQMPNDHTHTNRIFKGFNYEIPLKFKFKTGIYGPWNIYAEAGISIHYFTIMRAKDDYTFPENIYYNLNFHDVSSQYNNIQKSIFSNIGCEYAIKNSNRIFFQIGYNYMLSNMFSERPGFTYYYRSIGIVAGFMF